MTIISKISIKTVYGTVKPASVPAEGILPIARVYGIATKTKTGMSDNGDWTALIGEFEAVNVVTGESFSSSKAFLPAAAQGAIEVAMDATDKPVEFAYEIGLRFAENDYGYIFDVTAIQSPNQKDSLSKLRELAKLDKKATAKEVAKK